MKFQITKSELQTALGIAGKCVGGSIIPAHSNFLFELLAETLTVSATDGERFISYKCDIDGGQEISFQLPAVKLFEIVKLLPDQPLTFEIGDKSVKVIHATGNFEMAIEPGKDYPKMKHIEVYAIKMPSTQFTDALNRVLFATSQDALRPNLMGVFIEIGTKGITFTGANGAVLSTVNYPGEYEDNKVLITQKTVSTATSLPIEDSVNVSIGDTTILITPNDNTSLCCRVIDEKYPAYQGVIPRNNDKVLAVDRLHLLSALNRSKVFGKSVEDMLLISFSVGKETTITTTNLLSQSTKEVVTGEYHGDELSIELNCKLLIGCLSKLDCETVYLHFKDFKSAILITETEAEYGDTLMLTMPYSKPV